MAQATLTIEQAKEALKALRVSFDSEEVQTKLNALKAEAGGDPFKMMAGALPYAIEVQGHTIKKYGFESDQMGVTKFFLALQPHMADADVKTDFDYIRKNFMSPGV